jgi:hypothetical protein
VVIVVVVPVAEDGNDDIREERKDLGMTVLVVLVLASASASASAGGNDGRVGSSGQYSAFPKSAR